MKNIKSKYFANGEVHVIELNDGMLVKNNFRHFFNL